MPKRLKASHWETANESGTALFAASLTRTLIRPLRNHPRCLCSMPRAVCNARTAMVGARITRGVRGQWLGVRVTACSTGSAPRNPECYHDHGIVAEGMNNCFRSQPNSSGVPLTVLKLCYTFLHDEGARRQAKNCRGADARSESEHALERCSKTRSPAAQPRSPSGHTCRTRGSSITATRDATKPQPRGSSESRATRSLRAQHTSSSRTE